MSLIISFEVTLRTSIVKAVDFLFTSAVFKLKAFKRIHVMIRQYSLLMFRSTIQGNHSMVLFVRLLNLLFPAINIIYFPVIL